MAKIQIQNIVSTITLKHELDLEKIRNSCANECFFETLTSRKYTFRVVALRIPKPKMTLLIYKTGKVICTGAKTVRDAKQCVNYLINRLEKAGFSFLMKPRAKIVNIVATIDLKTELDIEKLISDLREESQFRVLYEPEQFPAAIVKFPVIQGSKATILLFTCGKLVCTGLTTCHDIQRAVQLLISKLNVELSNF